LLEFAILLLGLIKSTLNEGPLELPALNEGPLKVSTLNEGAGVSVFEGPLDLRTVGSEVFNDDAFLDRAEAFLLTCFALLPEGFLAI
jgi:hypothetical protein